MLCARFVVQSSIVLGSTLYYKALHKVLPSTILLCTTNLAQSTSQFYFVLQSFAQSTSQYYTTLHYKPCTKHSQVPLCATKLAQSTPQSYFVLKSLHKARPVRLCTTKLAHSTSQYDFVLQSLHKALPSTTLYYKACTKASFYTKKFLDREAFLYIMTAEIAAPKPDLSAKEKKTRF